MYMDGRMCSSFSSVLFKSDPIQDSYVRELVHTCTLHIGVCESELLVSMIPMFVCCPHFYLLLVPCSFPSSLLPPSIFPLPPPSLPPSLPLSLYLSPLFLSLSLSPFLYLFSLFFSPSLYTLSLSLPLSLPLSLSISPYLSLYPFLYPSIPPSLPLSIALSLPLFLSISLFSSLSPSLYPPLPLLEPHLGNYPVCCPQSRPLWNPLQYPHPYTTIIVYCTAYKDKDPA